MRSELHSARYAAIMLVLGLVTACEQAAYTVCGTLVCPAGYQCLDNKCASEDQIAVCVEQEDEAACDVSSLDGLCRGGFCQIDLCGNGLLDTYPVRGPEPCDGELGRLACADVGADFGLTTCTMACTSDTASCESFRWKAASTGLGIGRAVVTHGTGTFLARGAQLSWRSGTGRWRNPSRLANTIGDIVPFTFNQALVIAPRTGVMLGLWHYRAAENTLTDTGLTVATGDALRWSGGVALDAQTVLASLASEPRLYRLSGSQWTVPAVTVSWGPCATPGPAPPNALRLHWRATDQSAIGSIGNQVIQLELKGSALTCSVVRELPALVIGVGGQDEAITWAVDRDGRVYDGNWNLRNTNLAAPLGLETAVADGSRIWATTDVDIHLFEMGSWWRSSGGATILRDDFGGRIPAFHPVAVQSGRVLAAAVAQEAGLVERASREWMIGWRSAASGEVTALIIDEAGRPWASTFLPGQASLVIGSRARPITGLIVPITSMVFANGVLYAGTNQGLRKITVTDAAITQTVEGALGAIRGVWVHADTLYVVSALGSEPAKLYSKPLTATTWTTLLDLSTIGCGGTAWLAGHAAASGPQLFVQCRSPIIPDTPRKSYLAVLELPGAKLAVNEVPDGPYNRLAVDRAATAWLVGSQGRALRVPAPYSTPELLPVRRKSPFTGQLSQTLDALTDILVMPDDQVFIAGANRSLYWWDGARFVRVTPSQAAPVSYVALASLGAQIYIAHETGVDLLYTLPQ